MPQGALWYLRRFCYDTAQTANASALGGLLQIAGPTQIVMAGCRDEFASYAHGSKGSAVITTRSHHPGQVRIYTDNAAMTRWMQRTIETYAVPDVTLVNQNGAKVKVTTGSEGAPAQPGTAASPK